MMKLGIDFGTCYSSASLLIDNVLRPVKEPLKPLEYSFPSSVCVTTKGEIVISQAAENQRRLNPKGYKSYFKRDLETDIPYYLGEQQLRFMPEDLVTIMLTGLKKEAEKIINSSLESAIITVPATYLINKKKLMEEAGQKAGFTEVTLLEEPVAAAIYYAQKGTMGHQLNEGDILLVYDLGGGTFDGALIQKKGNSYTLLCQPLGDKQCGGIYFDQLIAQDFIKQLQEDSLKELLTSHRQDQEALRAKLNLLDWCRNFKHQLTVLEEYEDLPPLGSDSYTLSREQFEQMITPFIDSSCNLCEQLVQQSGIKWERIDRILLVGGSSRIPYVQKRLEKQFQRYVVAIDDPELAICYGAAIYETIQTEATLQTINPNLKQEKSEDKNKLAKDYFLKGNSEFDQENFREAVSQYDKAIALNPNEFIYYYWRGCAYYSLEEFALAIKDYDQALVIKPNDPSTLSWREKALSQIQTINSNLKQEKSEDNDKLAKDYFLKGNSEFDQENFREAVSQYDKAIALNPNEFIYYYWRGCAYYSLEEFALAIKDYDQALVIKPNDPSTLSWRKKALFKYGYSKINTDKTHKSFWEKIGNFFQ